MPPQRKTMQQQNKVCNKNVKNKATTFRVKQCNNIIQCHISRKRCHNATGETDATTGENDVTSAEIDATTSENGVI